MKSDIVCNPKVAVVMVPFPTQGHLNQVLHLSHIITTYGIPVHYAGSGPHNNQAKVRLNGWDTQNATLLHFHDFPLPDYKSVTPPKPDPSIHFPVHFVPLFDALIHLRQPVSDLLQELSTKFRRIIVIHDSLMTSVAQDSKSIPNAETYAFTAVSAFHTFTRDWKSIPVKPFELDSDFPSCIPTSEGCFSPQSADFLKTQFKFMGMESGRLYNTSRLIEGRYLKLLEKLTSGNAGMKHFAIGPLNPGQAKTRRNSTVQNHTCLEWLNKQEKASVLFVAFGSTTSMTHEQTTELAKGLERSRQKFIWVLRKADEVHGLEQGLLQQLPEGFEERVKDKGLVVRGWAPQLDILAHPSTGGFMSHCGWNSCIESITMGVPIAAWPMHSDQPKNTFFISQVLKIAIVVRDWEHRDELVVSSTIENAVKTLMASEEGAQMRKKTAELGDAIGESVSDGGASRLELDSFIAHITR